MSGRKSKKNQRLGSSRRGPKGLNRNTEKDDDDGFQQIAEPTTQFDHPPTSSIDQQTSSLESLPHAGGHKDSLMETELPERKRKMGSTRKSAGRFKVERNLDEELEEEYVTRPNTLTTEEQHEEEQSKPMSFPSDVSNTGLGKELGTTLMFVVSENEEKDAVHHQEITSYSHVVISDMPIDKAMGTSVHSFAEIPTASTAGQKKRMGSTRRPLGGKNSVQEHSKNMTENERKAEVMGEAKLKMSEEMVQAWDDVARDDPSSHTESALVSNQKLLAERAELKETDILAGTETMNQTVVFPLVDSEKPLPETSRHYETPLLNKELDFKFGSHTEDFDVLNKDAESDNSYVLDTRKDTNTSFDFRDVNTETKEEVLKQKGELSIKDQMSSLLPKQDTQLEELALNDQESSLSQHDLDNNCNYSIVGGSRSFDVPLSNISHDEPTTTNLPHEMSDAVVEKEQGNNLCNVAAVACDTLTDLKSITEEDEDPQILATRENENMSDERGSETENAFETGQDDARDHSVTQIIMDVRNNEKDGETITETIWISHQTASEVSAEKEEKYREQVQYSLNIFQTHSPPQDDAGKMPENDEVTNNKKETENTAADDVTSKSKEMFSFEDSATDTGSHTNQLFTQSPYKESHDLHERVSEKSEKKEIFFSVEPKNASFDRGGMRSEGTEGIKEMDAAPVVILDVDTNDSESENPEQNRALTEKQTDTSSDTNLQVLQVLDNVSTLIDSGLLFHDVIDVSSGERERVPEKCDISSFIPDDSYKPTTCHPESQENTGDPERVAVGGDTDLHLEIEAQNKTFDLTSEAKGTEKNMQDASVLAREIEVITDTVSVKSNMTTELDFFQTSLDVHMEALNISEKEVSGETDTILKQSDINIVPEDAHGEEEHSKSSPVFHKRKMGSTRRPLKGKKGQRQEDEEKEKFNLEYEPGPHESTLRSSKDGAKEREVEICQENDVGPIERPESALLQSSHSSDLVFEESTAISICHITESQTLAKINEESQENAGDVERVEAEEDKDLQLETDENIQDVSVTLVKEVEVIGDKVTMVSIMTTESDFLQSSPNAHVEALDLSENAGKEVSGETNTILKQSDISIIPTDSHGEETHSKSSPVIHKRKMGSTRRPLKGNKGRRKEMEHHDENETLDSEGMINIEKETFNLEDEPRPDESTLQSSKDGAKEQMEISEENDVGPVEGSESALLQSSCSSDLVSEESTTISICHVTESQDLTEINKESQENPGDVERVQAEVDKDLQLKIESQNKTLDLTTSEAEETEENTQDISVMLVREVEVIGDTVTVESNMTTESDFLQTSPDAHVEALNVSENAEKEVSGKTDTILEQSDISIIPEDSHGEETYSKSSPVIHKRKMGSTRRPLKGNKGQRKEMEHHDENETFDSESMINIEKETFSLEDEPSPDESTLQSSKDGAKEQMEISEKNDVGPVEGSESALLQSSSSSDLVSEESTTISICHVTESQDLTKINEESQENPGDVERVQADLQLKIDLQNETFDITTSEVEGTEENTQDISVMLVREVEVIGDTVTVESNMTTESDFLQTSPDAHVEALNVSENAEKEVSGETDTILEQSNISFIPEDSHGEETHSKLSPVIHKRKMGSTRRPLKGNKGQRKEMEHHDENETFDSESMINIEKETFSLEDEPRPDESTLQSSKDGAKEQMEISEENDVGPVEGSESALLQSSSNSDLVSEESTTISICHVTESQDLIKMNEESQENAGAAERVAAEEDKDLQLKIESQNKTLDLTTSEAEETEENTQDISVMLVREVEVIGDTVTVESNLTTESDFLQTSPDAHVEALKVSENAKKEASGETDTISEQSDISIIPEDSHGEETHSKSSPVIQKRKMGSTRRPLKGNKGRRKDHDEKEILEDEPCPDLSGYTAVSDISESQTLKKIHAGSQENTGDVEIVQAEEDKDLQLKIDSQNKMFDVTTSEAEGTEENIHGVSVTLVREAEVFGDTVTLETNMTTESDAHIEALKVSENAEKEISRETDKIPEQSDISIIPKDSHGEEAHSVDTVTLESNMTTESDFLQTSPDAHIEALQISENTEKDVSGEKDTIPEQCDISICPADSHRQEIHSKSSPVIHKRKMGSTRRPLKGKNEQGKEIEHDDENETFETFSVINVEKETFSLENEPSTYESTVQSSKDGAKEQKIGIKEENDVGPVEGSESTDLQLLCSSNLVSEESTAINICHITESQTITKISEQSQENAGEDERVAAEEDKDIQLKTDSQNKTFDLTTSETEENVQDVSVTLVREIEVTGDTVTVESKMTAEPDFLQTSPDAHVEAFKVSENAKKVVAGETNTIPEQSHINVIPADSHGEETHLKSSPVIHKRKMGSTRRPLKGKKGQRKDHDEKEIFILEDEPNPNESGHTAVSICDISESQTLTKNYAGSQENTGEIVPAEGDTEPHIENKTCDSTAFEGEATEENICEAGIVGKDTGFIGDTIVVKSNMTTESDDLIQNDTSTEAKLEALKVSDNAEETDATPKQSDTTIIPKDTHGEEAHSKLHPVVHKRKMGSTRRPLRGNIGQREETEHHDENETLDSEGGINAEKDTFSLKAEPSPEALQSTKDGEKEQMEISKKNDVEGPESTDLQSSCSSDLVSEESTAISICHVTESQDLTKINEESQENAGDVERMAAEEDKDLQLKINLQNQMFDLTTSEAEGTEDLSVMLVREVEVISPDAHVEALKASENAEKEVSGETDTILEQSDISIIPADSHGEETHSKSSPVIHKRKMGSTRRPLKGNKGQRKDHDEKEILEDEPNLDESGNTAVSDISESQILTKIHAGSQENIGDFEIVPAEEDKDLQLKIDSQNQMFDVTTSEAEGTEENIQDVSMVLVREVIADTVTVETNMTAKSDFLQTSDAHVEAFKVSENTEKEVSGETNTIPEQSDISVIPADSYKEKTHSKSSPVFHKRKMGSTRRPLKGKSGRREDHDEKEIFHLKDEPSMGEEQMEIREENDVGPVEGSEIFILEDEPNPDQSGYTAVSDISESQTLTKINTVSQENTGEIAPAEGDTEPHLENKTFDSTAFEREATAENICEGSVVVREVEFIGDTVIAESNDTKRDTKVSDNAECAVLQKADATPKQSDTTIIPKDTHGEEEHSKLHPVVHKRKMGSTRRPLRGNKGQREEIEHHDKNETLDSEGGINAEKDTFSLKDEPSPEALQSTKDGEKEQMEISKKNDVGPVEGSESTDLQSACSSDLVSEESTTISICHVTESQDLTKMNEESQENAGDVERMAAEEDKDLKINLQNQMFDLTTSEGEGTEENIQDVSVTLVREVEVIGDTVTVESNMTTESDFLQISPDAHVEALKVSENAEKEVSGETDTILEQSDISIIPADSQREETHSKSSPVIHKRKMGSTRRPLKGNKGRRKDHDEKEILEDVPGPDLSGYTVLSDISESQTLKKIHAGSQENIGDFEIVPPEENKDLQLKIDSQNKMFDVTTSEAEGTEENIHDVSVTSVREVEVIGDTVTVDSNMTTESDFLQTSDAHINALKVPENTEKEVSGETDTIPEQSHINIIPADSHGEETHSKSSPVIHKRKMGSTRRPLKGNKGQRKDCDEKDILEDEPNLDESRYTAVSDISESQTLTKIHAGSQEKIEDFEIATVEGYTEPCIENKTFDSTAFKREATEENICEDNVLGKEIEFIEDTVTVESNMTIRLDLLQNDTSTDAKPEALISEIAEISGKTDTIPKQSDTNIIPEDPHGEKLHTEVSLNAHKRKMGSTRRPLRGNTGQRKVGVHFKEKNGDGEGVSEEEVTETHSEIQNRDNVVGHNLTQDIMYIRENEDEERKTTKTVDMSVLELCDDLELKQRSDGPSQDDTVSHETQIHVSSDNVPPTKVAEMHPDSKRSMQKRKMGSTRKRGKRMVNEEEVQKEGEAENTTDDGTTKSEENLPIEEAITGSSVHQQLFSLSVNKESHDIQDIVSKSEISEQSDPSSTIKPELLIESECSSKPAAEMISDLPLGDVDTYLVPKQNVIPKESHREDQSDLNPVVQKRKMGSTRKTLRGNKGQGRQGEPQKMDRDIEEMTKEQDTEPYLATSARKTESKFDEEVEQNFLVVASNLFPESENKMKEVGHNIHDLTEVSEENRMEHTGNDSNSVNEAINLFEGTKDKFVLTVSHEDVHQTLSADYPDQHVGSEHEQMENIHNFIPTQELKNTQDDVVHENNSRKTPATQEKRRKMGSTRRNPSVMHGKNMADNEDVLGVTEDSQSKEESSVSIPELKSEMLDLKVENLEPTPQICDNQLVDADVTKHPESETVSTEKRRKMGSTRKNLREGRVRGKRDGYEDTETADSEMSLVREDIGEQTIQDYSNQSEDSLLSEIEKALNKTSQSSQSGEWELIVKTPNPDDLANAPDLDMPENSEIKSLQPTPSAEPNSPGRRRRKMGSTRKNPRQQLKAETEDEDKVDREIDENLKTDMQGKKDLERVEVSVVHNITENKEYLDVSSAHTSSSQLKESTNPVSQEKTSPSTKRKFGSRRANKGKQGLGGLSASDFGNESEDGDHKPDSAEVQDKLHSIDLTVCDPSCTLQPESQPISHPVSEERNMEAKNDEAASKGTGAGLVSLDQTIKHDRIAGAKQTVNLKNRISDADVVQFNIVMVGNSCVGKTSFIRRFHEGQFTEDYRSTIGVDTCVQTVALPDKIVKLQIWDTAGQERFHSITTQVFHRADGLLFMYEITSSNSFVSVRDWISRARERAPDDAIMMLLGNKNDSVERQVQIQEGADLAREYNMHFMECSAATGANVSESMRTLAELLAQQRKSQKEKHATLRREPPQKKSGCC